MHYNTRANFVWVFLRKPFGSYKKPPLVRGRFFAAPGESNPDAKG